MKPLRRHTTFLLAGLLAAGCAPKPSTETLPEPPDSRGQATTPAPSAAPADGKHVLLLSNASSPFWNAVEAGMNAGASEQGVAAKLERNNDGSVAGQIRLLEQALTDKDQILGVAISVLEPDAQGLLSAMKALRDAGVPVVAVDSDCQPEYRDVFVGTDNREAGVALGKKTAELKPEGGKFCAFVGQATSQNASDRLQGFKEGAGDKFQEVEVYQDKTDPAVARQNVEVALSAHPEADVMLGLWSYNGPAIAEVVDNAKKLDSVLVVSFDAEPNLLPVLEAGKVKVTLVQKPYEMGRQSVMIIKAIANGDEALKKELLPEGGDHVNTGFSLETPETFAEFKKYLDEKGLQGS